MERHTFDKAVMNNLITPTLVGGAVLDIYGIHPDGLILLQRTKFKYVTVTDDGSATLLVQNYINLEAKDLLAVYIHEPATGLMDAEIKKVCTILAAIQSGKIGRFNIVR